MDFPDINEALLFFKRATIENASESAVDDGNTTKIRVSTIVLSIANIIMALLLVVKILFLARKKQTQTVLETGSHGDPKGDFVGGSKNSDPWWKNWVIPTSNVFPFLLGIAIAIQGCCFLYSESINIDGGRDINQAQCNRLSQLTWGAIWTTPSLTLVFSVECFVRSFSHKKFQPRENYTTVGCICLSVVLIAFITIPVRDSSSLCNGQLMQFVNQLSSIGLALSGVIILIWFFTSIAIWRNLNVAGMDVDIEERISAVNVLVYSCLNVLQLIFILPFFATSSDTSVVGALAFMATVFLNLLGIICLIAQHFIHLKTQKMVQAALLLDSPAEKSSSKANQSSSRRSFDTGRVGLPVLVAHDHQAPWMDRPPSPDDSPVQSDPVPAHGSLRATRLREEIVSVITELKHLARSSPRSTISRSSNPRPNTLSNKPPPALHQTISPRTAKPRGPTLPSSPRHLFTRPFAGLPSSPRPISPRARMDLSSTALSLKIPPPARPSRDNTPSLNLQPRRGARLPRTETLQIGLAVPIDGHHTERTSQRSTTMVVVGYKPPPPPMETAHAPMWDAGPSQTRGNSVYSKKSQGNHASQMRAV